MSDQRPQTTPISIENVQPHSTPKKALAVKSHHSPDLDLAEVQNMAAIRDLLFGKQTAAINETINAIEDRFDKVAKGHAYRIETLEQEANKPEIQQRINELSLKLGRLENQLLKGTKAFKEEIQNADRRHEMLLFEQIKVLSEATLKDFEALRRELRAEITQLKEETKKNSQVGEALIGLGKHLQGEPNTERSSQDDRAK